jgi:hypothetical protein
MQKCSCGFQPARGSLDEAKSYVLSEQFRSSQELNDIARAIRAGELISFRDEELKVALGIGNWNAAVTAAFLVSAVLLGLLLGGALASLSAVTLASIGAVTAVAFVIAFRLMGFVDRKVGSRN